MALVAAALVTTAASAALPGSTNAGELVYKGCLAARSPVHDGKTSCKETAEGDNVIDDPLTLSLSPDGGSLYTGSGVWCNGRQTECSARATVGRFGRDPLTGALAYRDCLTGDIPVYGPPTDCTQITAAEPRAFGAGLADVAAVAVSPDGRSLYAASARDLCGDYDCYGGNALARFDRDPATGALTYRDCITGDQRSGPSGSGACTEIPSATPEGQGSGLLDLRALALSPDGKSLYTAATKYVAGGRGDAAIARFDRDPETGVLVYRGCITGDTALGPSGSGACAEIPTAAANVGRSGLGDPQSVTVSPDGISVYVGGDIIARFDRNPVTGDLTYMGCFAGKGSSAAAVCTEIPQPMYPQTPVMSPDGRFVYASGDVRAEGSTHPAGVVQFRRDPGTGALTYERTVKGPIGGSMALGANGRALYTGSMYSTVARYRVDRRTGRASYAGCLTGDRGETGCTPIPTATGGAFASGLERIGAMAATGRSLYAVSTGGHGDDIARFAIAPQTRIAKGRTRGQRAVFKFRARPASRFECKLTGRHVKRKLRRWRHCGSRGFGRHGKQVYRHLRPGRKVFKVRATDRSRTTDPTPAKHRWRIR
jgi:hypothetical protein